jgi:hypothetical protein
MQAGHTSGVHGSNATAVMSGSRKWRYVLTESRVNWPGDVYQIYHERLESRLQATREGTGVGAGQRNVVRTGQSRAQRRALTVHWLISRHIIVRRSVGIL